MLTRITVGIPGWKDATPAARALSLRRIERGAHRRCNEISSGAEESWTTANLRVWQGVMCRAMDARNVILSRYLQTRRARP